MPLQVHVVETAAAGRARRRVPPRTLAAALSTGLLCALALAAPAAEAGQPDWVTCEPKVDNAPLEPRADGTFAPDPANPYKGDHTKWSTQGVEILLKRNDGDKRQFFLEGMNYEPTQIGGAAQWSPFNDFFYTNTNDTWRPLWKRDAPLMRAMGVNVVRNYGMWKWEPGFAQSPDQPTANIGTAEFWDKMNWDADAAAEKDTQFCAVGSYTFKHPTHMDFLDMMWNGGVDPIYVWIGISLPKEAVDTNVPNKDLADYRQFYLHTAKWLAKKYGDHPAVMGFVVGNEIGNTAKVQTSMFWKLINDLHQVVKASAPDKLTATTFHDTPDYALTITQGEYKGFTGPQVYEPDVWGFNPYTNPSLPEATLDRYRKNVVVGCEQRDGGPCVKPLIWGEWGVPANTREVSTKPAELYPNKWTAPNFIWNQRPPPAECLSAADQGPPPGSGADPAEDYKRGETSAKLLPKRTGDYKLPGALAKLFPDSGYAAGDELPAALQADWLAAFWDVTRQHKADNSVPREENKLTSGGFAFEFRDEWWKDNPHPAFHGISGPATNCPAGCDRKPGDQCEPGPANVVFPGGWGDEQWFGVTGARPYKRKATDDVTVNGKLNGGPDTLIPRAAVVALCEAYGACD